MNMNEENPHENKFKPEQWEKYLKLLGRRFIRVDPNTKRPHDNSKDFFWEILHMYPATPAGGNMNEPDMQLVVQRYHRARTYQSDIEQGGNLKVTKHEAWHDLDGRGQLRAPGYISITLEGFLKQFVEDGLTAQSKSIG